MDDSRKGDRKEEDIGEEESRKSTTKIRTAKRVMAGKTATERRNHRSG